MRCSVKGCKNWNGDAASSYSFFHFPSDKELLKKWISFCRHRNTFNVKTSFICMEHFTDNDYENNLQFEMGFSKKRFLKRGAVPSIYKPLSGNHMVAAERAHRIQRRDNKKIVKSLLQEYDEPTIPLRDERIQRRDNKKKLTLLHQVYDEPTIPLREVNNENDSSPMNDPLAESTYPNEPESVERQTLQVKTNTINDLVEEMESLRKEIAALRRENSCLQKTQKKQLSEITALKQSAIQAERWHDFDIRVLGKRLAEAQYEAKNMEEKLQTKLTKGQITKLKKGIKITAWSEEDIAE